MCECMANGLGRPSAESKCTDIDDCSGKQKACTGPFELCQTEIASIMCNCTNNEFERPSADSKCTDLDDCSDELNPCTGPFQLYQKK